MLPTLTHKVGQYSAAIQDWLTVGQQISLAVATLCFGLVAVIAAGAATVSRYQTAELHRRADRRGCRASSDCVLPSQPEEIA